MLSLFPGPHDSGSEAGVEFMGLSGTCVNTEVHVLRIAPSRVWFCFPHHQSVKLYKDLPVAIFEFTVGPIPIQYVLIPHPCTTTCTLSHPPPYLFILTLILTTLPPYIFVFTPTLPLLTPPPSHTLTPSHPHRDHLGKEIISRFSTDLKTDATWYTDANGRQIQKRV